MSETPSKPAAQRQHDSGLAGYGGHYSMNRTPLAARLRSRGAHWTRLEGARAGHVCSLTGRYGVANKASEPALRYPGTWYRRPAKRRVKLVLQPLTVLPSYAIVA